MKAFPTNLKKARQALSFTQEKAAAIIGVKTRAYQSYEEGRAEPRAGILLSILKVFAITNPDGFYSDPGFQWSSQGEAERTNNATMEYKSMRGPYQPRMNICGS